MRSAYPHVPTWVSLATPIYYKPLFTLDRAPPLSKHPILIYTLQYEQGTAAKLGRIFIPSDDTPK